MFPEFFLLLDLTNFNMYVLHVYKWSQFVLFVSGSSFLSLYVSEDTLAKERKTVKSLSPFWLFATPWTVAYQILPSMEFSRQEYWSGLSFPSPLQSWHIEIKWGIKFLIPLIFHYVDESWICRLLFPLVICFTLRTSRKLAFLCWLFLPRGPFIRWAWTPAPFTSRAALRWPGCLPAQVSARSHSQTEAVPKLSLPGNNGLGLCTQVGSVQCSDVELFCFFSESEAFILV